jgi:hypothetical protein
MLSLLSEHKRVSFRFARRAAVRAWCDGNMMLKFVRFVPFRP